MKKLHSLISAEELAALLGNYGDDRSDEQKQDNAHSKVGLEESQQVTVQEEKIESVGVNID